MDKKHIEQLIKFINDLDGYGLVATDDGLLREQLRALKYEYYFGE